MRLILNANVTPSPYTGVGEYIQHLANWLPRVDPALELGCLVDSLMPDRLAISSTLRIGLPFRPDKSFKHIAYQPYIMRCLRKAGAQVYHIPNTSPLFYKVCPTVITIHDLQEFFTLKYGRGRSLYRQFVNLISARTADVVITVSEYARAAIIDKLHVPAEKVVAIWNGCDQSFQPMVYADRLIQTPYLLSVGQLQPGKNYLRLLEAFARAETGNLALVIVGSKGWDYESIFMRAAAADLAGRVIFLHDVSKADLVKLYNQATLCALPSLYEGFGLPALEAMACGTPCIAADNSSFPEVLGNAGRYFDPYNIEQIATAISSTLAESSRRKIMQELGLARAQQFDWQTTAQKTLSIYSGIL